jgi:hypothetical protein
MKTAGALRDRQLPRWTRLSGHGHAAVQARQGDGKPLADISTSTARGNLTSRLLTRTLGHVTLNVARDGVRAAGRATASSTREGKFLKEIFLATSTLDRGPRRTAFRRSEAAYMFISDIQNNTIWFSTEDGKGRIGSTATTRGLPRPAHDCHRFEGEHLYRRSPGWRTGPEIRPATDPHEFTRHATETRSSSSGPVPLCLRGPQEN